MTYCLQLTILYCALKCFVKRIDLMLSILTTKKKNKNKKKPKTNKNTRRHEGTFRYDSYVYYLECDDSCTRAYV